MSLATTEKNEQDDNHRNCRCDASRMATEIQIEQPAAAPRATCAPSGQPANHDNDPPPLFSPLGKQQYANNHEDTKGDGADDEDAEEDEEEPDVQLSDFIGEHGYYQLALSLLLFVRYVLLGLMANSGPLMTPDVIFYCQLPMQEILYIMPNISKMSAYEQELEIKEEFKQVCQIDLHLYQNQSQLVSNASKLLPGQSFKTSSISTNGSHVPVAASISSQTEPTPVNKIRECTEFTYQLAPDQGRTLTSEFNLVCDDDWLRSLFQSLLSASIVLAHVIWGTFSDKYGRFQAQRLCLIVSLLAGTLSIFAWDFWSFTLLRAWCSFGDLGMVVSMTTTMVELVGSNYRGLSVALVNFGYALGVTLLPYLVGYYQDFRLVVGFTVLCHMVTMPFVLAHNESVRWLLTNRRHKAARRELKRIMRWNHNCSRVWSSIRRQVICCGGGGGDSEHPMGKGDEKGGNGAGQATSLPRSQSGWAPSALLHKKEAFQLKFETFVKQLERQNLCDPSSNCPLHSELQTPRPATRRFHQTGRRAFRSASVPLPAATPQPLPPVPLSRFEPLLRPGPTPVAAGSEPERQHAELDETILGAEVKPRLLDMVDPEHIELIRAVESVTQQQVAERRISISSDIDDRPTMMDRTVSDASGVVGGGGGGKLFLSDEQQHVYEAQLRQRQQQCQPDCINLFAHQLSFVGRVSRLFRDKKLMIATFTIVWTTFNSELLYTSFIIINLYAGEDVNLNYVIGGCAEAVAAVVASLLLSYSPRRLSLIAFWLLISFSCFGLSLAHIDNIWAVWLLALAKFSQSCLSSIASVAAYECFPTFLRQSGSGLVFTLGMMGSVFAPLIFAEFDDHAGMDRVLIIFSISSLTAALLIYKFLKETRDCELM